jgi:hypothetical protein
MVDATVKPKADSYLKVQTTRQQGDIKTVTNRLAEAGKPKTSGPVECVDALGYLRPSRDNSPYCPIVNSHEEGASLQ